MPDAHLQREAFWGVGCGGTGPPLHLSCPTSWRHTTHKPFWPCCKQYLQHPEYKYATLPELAVSQSFLPLCYEERQCWLNHRQHIRLKTLCVTGLFVSCDLAICHVHLTRDATNMSMAERKLRHWPLHSSISKKRSNACTPPLIKQAKAAGCRLLNTVVHALGLLTCSGPGWCLVRSDRWAPQAPSVLEQVAKAFALHQTS